MRHLILFVVLLSNLGFCYDSIPSKEDAKMYISAEQISLSQQGILVNMGDSWVKTDALYTDEAGIYITHNERDWLHWKCPICGYINSSITDNHCKKCGH